jgi:2-haloacid dehalogenase
VLGVRREEVLFVANHEFDVVEAKAAGMRTALIDRRRRPLARWPHRPDLALPSMTALAEAVG